MQIQGLFGAAQVFGDSQGAGKQACPHRWPRSEARELRLPLDTGAQSARGLLSFYGELQPLREAYFPLCVVS